MSPAYAKDIVEKFCSWGWCGDRATEEVFNTFNAYIGSFCAEHAREKISELDEAHAANPHDGRAG